METSGEDVKRMMDDPRRAIRTMSVPLTVAVLISYIQNFVDTVWCSGLGSSAISAITLSGPTYWIIIDIGIGLGIGASTAISRALGADDKERANSLASQTLVLTLIVSVLSMIILFLLCDPVLRFVNDGGDISLSRKYVIPYLFCIIPIVLHGVIVGMLRSEGASRKVLQLSIISTVLNLIIDPILIYPLGLGITGAAMATCLSFIVTTCIGMYWYLTGSMYVKPRFKGFRIKTDEMKDIMYVGIPSMGELLGLSILMIPQNMLVFRTGGDAGVVLAMTPYKFIILTIMPAQGLAQAMLPVTSALQGAGRMKDAKDGFLYTIKLTTLICIALSLFLIVFADPLMYLFTYSDEMADLHDGLTRVLRMYGFITLFAGLSETFSSVLQSLRKAMTATVMIIIRELVFIAMYWYASTISMEAIYHSMVAGMFFGLLLMGVFASRAIMKMNTNCSQQNISN
ncbi:MAG: MATE family efflux transporter [archaeon]|nr:MATE family efflux transporter [archaeon]